MNAITKLVAELPLAGPDIMEAASKAYTPHAVELVVRRVLVGWSAEEIALASLRALENHAPPESGRHSP